MVPLKSVVFFFQSMPQISDFSQDFDSNHAQLHICYVFLPTESYYFTVNEDEPVGFNIGILKIKDFDELQNKEPIFTVDDNHKHNFNVQLDHYKDGLLKLKKVVFPSSRPLYTNLPWYKMNPVDI